MRALKYPQRTSVLGWHRGSTITA